MPANHRARPSSSFRSASPRAGRRRRFCEEYVKDYNGAQAAIRAGYSATSARQRASELLKTPEVASLLQTLEGDARERAAELREAVLQELKDLAFSSILDYIEMDSTGVRLRPGLSQAEIARAAFSGIKISKSEGREGISLKMGGKLVALDMLAKVLGMYETTVTRQTRRRR